ncbi:hypothetical protein AB0365_08080 [Brevibacterium casei]|uniref:hypothetical protein n=1 Tax=Brevibacterium casei TaxID=33889 RepID=UPI00344EC9B1
MKNNRFTSVLVDAVKVAIAAWAAIYVEPTVSEILPTVGAPLQYLIAALFTAVVLEVALQLFFGWPRIAVVWGVKGEEAPISEVLVRIRPGSSESQVFTLKISVPAGGWLGHLFLRSVIRPGARLVVGIEQASVVPTTENSFKTGGKPTVAPDDEANGFAVELGKTPRPGPWHWADVRWRDESTPRDDEFNISYSFRHPKPFTQFLLNTTIRRSTNARKFRIVGP